MVIPISAVSEAIIVSDGDVYALPDGTNIISKRGECIPLLPLASTLKLVPPRPKDRSKALWFSLSKTSPVVVPL
ncbi:hypothetical protein [Asaia astilbis]|uniref:hypothetical protein n=1 Tax=Asaia astilbis TaxID=610244 RepID=UPI001E5B1344|nr:hypothetical protein [Asaia astilbis]